MMNIACNLSCSVAVMVLLTGTALAYPDTSSKSLKLNTHTYSRNSIRESALIKLATVCFITDTEDCQGRGFIAPGGDPWNPDSDKRCDKEGYLKTSCETLYEAYNYCPYDEKYWEKCVCKTEFKESCKPPFWGIGSACDGKYEKCCKNECSAGYDLNSGSCRQASSLKTECGNACYKILNNTCSSGSLTPTAETGGNRNKSVATTECGNLCWQSFNDNCPTGYVKDKAGGKCYETSVSYTPYGSACYQEMPCCGNLCSLTTCPLNGSCSYEACSGKYCFTDCTPQSAWFCTPPSTTDCGALGYKSGAACSGGLKCPFGNFWYCM